VAAEPVERAGQRWVRRSNDRDVGEQLRDILDLRIDIL
jgi:hypothetical protein